MFFSSVHLQILCLFKQKGNLVGGDGGRGRFKTCPYFCSAAFFVGRFVCEFAKLKKTPIFAGNIYHHNIVHIK
jgi:hypothetical protein